MKTGSRSKEILKVHFLVGEVNEYLLKTEHYTIFRQKFFNHSHSDCSLGMLKLTRSEATKTLLILPCDFCIYTTGHLLQLLFGALIRRI